MPSMLRRPIVAVALALALALPSPQARTDDCKPDVSRVDKITKLQQDIWVQKVGGTGFGASLMGSTDMAVSVTAGRYGSINAVNVEILKEEASAASASFDSSLRAVKGNTFFLGFKEGGEPLTFVATDVANQTAVRNDVLDFGTGKVVTSVLLSCVLSDETLAAMRDALTKKPIDAIRVLLVGNIRVEYSLTEKTSKRLMAKFQCFFEAMDKRGLVRPAAHEPPPLKNDPDRMAQVQGRYARKGKPSDFIDLNADGTAGLRQDGHTVRGSFTVNGDAIAITSPEMPELTSRGHVAGDTITDDEGTIWEKMTEAQRAATAPLPDEPTPSKDVTASPVGRYLERGSNRYIELMADGTVACNLRASDGRPCNGTYKIKGNVVFFKLSVGSSKIGLRGSQLVGKTQVWDKQADTPKVLPEAQSSAPAPVAIRLGMTPQQVEEAQGSKPQKVIDLGAKQIYVYPDLKITFMDGKVSDVQ